MRRSSARFAGSSLYRGQGRSHVLSPTEPRREGPNGGSTARRLMRPPWRPRIWMTRLSWWRDPSSMTLPWFVASATAGKPRRSLVPWLPESQHSARNSASRPKVYSRPCSGGQAHRHRGSARPARTSPPTTSAEQAVSLRILPPKLPPLVTSLIPPIGWTWGSATSHSGQPQPSSATSPSIPSGARSVITLRPSAGNEVAWSR